MGLFSENKCTRCDRRYSGLRGKCPYCGARKSKRSKKSVDRDKVGWKLIAGIVLMVILIAAVAAILVISLRSTDTVKKDDTADTPAVTDTDTEASDNTNTASEGVTSVEGDEKDDTSAATPSDNSTPAAGSNDDSQTEPTVNSITITYLGEEGNDFTLNVGDIIELGYTTDPASTEVTATWESSDASVASVLPTGEVTAIASGTATLTITADGASAECIVRVP